ncbi:MULTISPECIES: acyl-CoA dehydratase activase [unclassified Campylobacter]|uniref:acyl-CoA dehydratase activase n=1 Tax=unclassified Campylobacter TaxID=2593542 RepID=UPI0022E9AB47|nr:MULTISPECIES: acyl-CoA dehydratase activase [unclassified Campylobacter]MDA3043484.1 acyl-CoA dehydratase activase [Campylobacter sp. JMF_09 ED2]MDA3045238.1 acyl-CoA dehydratase activase [Campylobacter sp. JMF_07 ED4]MDA3064162.1 acyl-CoA dehydratase activase [Campylobacter sp. JMF_11 EL3]MDA3071966.1 acyl-CoA dehydratase activase [Campylobacter sp. VBCF_03 NA9]MDA3075350.1 acyl-CoA dehydratase activase [Campylobacter sp. JMF_05 ED3]
MIYLGIDVGSTTVKTVILNENNEILEKTYQRHLAKPKELVLQRILEIQKRYPNENFSLSIAGSAGMGIAKNCEIPFVQEVYATSLGVRQMFPKTDIVIELGGEDAKIIFLTGGVEERMNGSCAGGTGAFIDQMTNLLNLDIAELDRLSFNASKIYPIASRCGVFAKSDIQPLLNQGVRKEDISASIYAAVVEQTIAGLAQGREVKGNILFLGGPLFFLKGLQKRFKEALNLSDENATFPDIGPFFVAYGSAIYAKKTGTALNLDKIIELLQKSPNKELLESEEPLFSSQAEFDEFIARHEKASVPKADIASYSGSAYLGVDCGSTTIKVVLIGENYELLYKFYSSNKGDPINILQEKLAEIYALCGSRIKIKSSGVTGYGEELIKTAFGFDYGIVETIAHYSAARHFNPKVDFIIDIGGQDIKCFSIKDGNIDSIVLNEACSSGCGSFLQTFSNSLGHEIKNFAKMGLFASHPAKLGSRCTVFMNSSVKQAQKDGASVEDISAGLAISVIKNAIYKVIRVRNSDDLGQNIVVQGGTFLNNAVLRAFEKELGKNVIRLDISELMGAYGAALFARDNAPESSNLITSEKLALFTHKSEFDTCKLCTNKCPLTITHFENSKFITGNKCERGAGKAIKNDITNLFEFKNELLKKYKKLPKDGAPKVGIPLVLNMYEMIPFWSAFFENLGMSVALSRKPRKETLFLANQSIPSDTVCYPAKSVHGHIYDLLAQNVDFIFYPCMSYNLDENISENCYNCPVVAYYPELIKANVSALDERAFIYPHLDLNAPEFFAKTMRKELANLGFKFKLDVIKNAVFQGKKELENYKNTVLIKGEETLNLIREQNLSAIVLAGRPYHIDKSVNHGIDRYLNSLGFIVLSEDSLPLMQVQTKSLNQWTYHARLYSAARFICKYPKMQLVQLVSFGCGIDAITGDEVRDLLRANGKIYTQLKIDEVTNLGAVKIRLRSLKATMLEREKAQFIQKG